MSKKILVIGTNNAYHLYKNIQDHLGDAEVKFVGKKNCPLATIIQNIRTTEFQPTEVVIQVGDDEFAAEVRYTTRNEKKVIHLLNYVAKNQDEINQNYTNLEELTTLYQCRIWILDSFPRFPIKCCNLHRTAPFNRYNQDYEEHQNNYRIFWQTPRENRTFIPLHTLINYEEWSLNLPETKASLLYDGIHLRTQTIHMITLRLIHMMYPELEVYWRNHNDDDMYEQFLLAN